MDKNFKHLLMAELHSASSYVERLFHGLFDLTDLGKLPQCKSLSESFYFDLMTLLETSFVRRSWINPAPSTPSIKKVRRSTKMAITLMESLIELDFETECTQENVVEFINLLYEHAYELHQFCHLNSTLDIQLPRVNLVQMNDQNSNEDGIPFFLLPLNAIIEAEDEERPQSISSLGGQRDKKYQDCLVRGHESIFHKNYQEALEHFNEAMGWSETAEILTLIGWAEGLLGNTGTAKEFCLKAIRKDRHYGPPYNDLGTYLLSEGQVDESLKWFELAKKARKYQNREYPFINSGRAYLAKKEIQKALVEFERALEIAPFNQDLERTILKLKANIEKGSAWKKNWQKSPIPGHLKEVDPTGPEHLDS